MRTSHYATALATLLLAGCSVPDGGLNSFNDPIHAQVGHLEKNSLFLIAVARKAESRRAQYGAYFGNSGGAAWNGSQRFDDTELDWRCAEADDGRRTLKIGDSSWPLDEANVFVMVQDGGVRVFLRDLSGIDDSAESIREFISMDAKISELFPGL